MLCGLDRLAEMSTRFFSPDPMGYRMRGRRDLLSPSTCSAGAGALTGACGASGTAGEAAVVVVVVVGTAGASAEAGNRPLSFFLRIHHWVLADASLP